jgi:hypothetical protein
MVCRSHIVLRVSDGLCRLLRDAPDTNQHALEVLVAWYEARHISVEVGKFIESAHISGDFIIVVKVERVIELLSRMLLRPDTLLNQRVVTSIESLLNIHNVNLSRALRVERLERLLDHSEPGLGQLSPHGVNELCKAHLSVSVGVEGVEKPAKVHLRHLELQVVDSGQEFFSVEVLALILVHGVEPVVELRKFDDAF